MKLIKFMADKVSLNGPSVDGSYKVTFTVGEYMVKNIQELVSVFDKNIKVAVQIEEEDDNK